jgi:hypothetical protein
MPGISADSDVLDLALIRYLRARSGFAPLPLTQKHARDVHHALPRE